MSRLPRQLSAAFLVVATLVASGGAGASAAETGGESMIAEDKFAGRWLKETTDSCAARYPAELLLRDGGIYEAPGGPEAGAVWHSGEWRLESETEFVIQMANDEMRHYALVALNTNELALKDAEGCRIVYRRAPE